MNKAIELKRLRGLGEVHKQIQIPNNPIFTKRFFEFMCIDRIYISSISKSGAYYVVHTNINKKKVTELITFLNSESEQDKI